MNQEKAVYKQNIAVKIYVFLSCPSMLCRLTILLPPPESSGHYSQGNITPKQILSTETSSLEEKQLDKISVVRWGGGEKKIDEYGKPRI